MKNRHGLPVLDERIERRRVEQGLARRPHKLEVAGSRPAPATTVDAGRFTHQGEQPNPARPAPYPLRCVMPGCKAIALIWRGEEAYCLNCISTILVREHREGK